MLKGLIVALVTPFNKDVSINYSKALELINIHIKNKVNGVLLFGTTGEASTIDFKEKLNFFDFIVPKIKGKIDILTAIETNNTLKAIEEVKYYNMYDFAAILVISPYYNKTNNLGLLKHFEMIANASLTPIIIYNVPSRTNVYIPIDIIAKLAKIKNIIGIKEASANLEYATKISEFLCDDFVMYCGCDELILPYYAIGAKGLISVVANIYPKRVKLILNYLENNDFFNAKKHFDLIKRIIFLLFIETNPIPIKALMNYHKMNVGSYRMPLYEMNKENYELLIKESDLLE